MRSSIFSAVFLIAASAPVVAETPWEAYLRFPTAAAATAVRTASYSSVDPGNRKLELDLAVLENDLAAGEPESTKLAVRLRHQFQDAAAIAELLDEMLGRSIRSNPVAYLQAIAESDNCPGAVPSGDLFVDRPDARNDEARARMQALMRVSDAGLLKKRDKCVSLLQNSTTASANTGVSDAVHGVCSLPALHANHDGQRVRVRGLLAGRAHGMFLRDEMCPGYMLSLKRTENGPDTSLCSPEELVRVFGCPGGNDNGPVVTVSGILEPSRDPTYGRVLVDEMSDFENVRTGERIGLGARQ